MKKILLVDDSEDVLFLVPAILEGLYEIHTATNLSDVNRCITSQEIDLILMDVNMPILRGDKMTQMLKMCKQSEEIPVVLFSAMDAEDLEEKVENVGANGYICKTLDEELLTFRIKRFFEAQ
ncbi:response regulator [Candidatus Uabimicrobium sp. HlEnr_7]|uniref:response regulator n=1 Tax=Candidatus Uabimicrobium helgolandensis TaxID=3095367 RepID=UPI003558FCBD